MPDPGLTLKLSHVLPASRPVVFALFTDPDHLSRWWGPAGFSTPSIDFRPSVNESYRIEMQPPDGEAFFLTGEFREVDPPNRLAYTFVWEPPDPDDVETVVELTFADRGNSTEVVLTQGPFDTEERRKLHHSGWEDSFEKLHRLAAKAQSGG